MENFTLIERINKKDKDTFNTIVKVYNNRLIFFAKSYVGNNQDAEEIVQDVFIKLFSNSVTIKTNLNSFLFTATKNLCIDFLRKKTHKIYIDDNSLQKEYLVNYRAIKDNGYTKLIEKELEKQIELAIEELPDRCKAVFLKSRFENLKNKEISKELNISVKTVENQMTKALKHLTYKLSKLLKK